MLEADRPTDRQTDIVTYRAAITAKNLRNLADSGLRRATVDLDDLKTMRSNLHHLGMSQHHPVLLWFAMIAIFYCSLKSPHNFPS